VAEDFDEQLDMQGVHRDDRLLDALAARRLGDVEDPADPVVPLLAALAADVDAAPLPEIVPDGIPEPAALFAAGRRRGLLLAPRVGVAAGVAGAVVFASGVATAVSGDPLAPLEPLRRVIVTVAEQVTAVPAKRESVHRTLDGADDALSRGDSRTAAHLISEAESQLQELDRPPEDLQSKLVELQQELGKRAVTTPGAVPLPGDPTTDADPGASGMAAATPDPPETAVGATSDPTTTTAGDPTPTPSDGTGTPNPSDTPPSGSPAATTGGGTPSGGPSGPSGSGSAAAVPAGADAAQPPAASKPRAAPRQPRAVSQPPAQQPAPKQPALEQPAPKQPDQAQPDQAQPAPEQPIAEQPAAPSEEPTVAGLVSQVAEVADVAEVVAEVLP
jgi:hypothetical protein